MRKSWKMRLAFLLALVLMFSGVSLMPAQVQADTSTEVGTDVSSGKTVINTWDFSEESQLTDEFSLYKRNSDGASFTTSNGYLYAAASTSSDCRKAVLNTEYDINAASVDIYPVNGAYYGGLMLGITGKVGGGTTANPSIMISVEDSNVSNNTYKVRVYGYVNKTEYKILDISKSSLLYSDKEAQAVNLAVVVSDSMLTITLTLLSDTASPVNEGIYQQVVDIAAYQDGNGDKIFSSDSLEGKAGLFARTVETYFDDFTVASPVTPLEAMTIYDFDDSKEFDSAFSLYKRNSDGTNFVVNEDGFLSAAKSTASDCRKAILDRLYDVEQLSVDIYPVDGMYYGGIMLGINKNDSLTYGGGVTANPSVMVMVQDTGTGENGVTLRVNAYGDNDGDGSVDDVTIFSKKYDSSKNNALYLSKSAQAVRLSVKVDGTKLVVRVSMLANGDVYVEEQVDITLDSAGESTAFDSTALVGKVGVAAREYAGYFDDFAIKGNVSTKVDTAEEIEVNGTTATYTFDDTKELLDFDFYRSDATGGFGMKDGMLTVNTASKEGECKAILRGDGRTYQKVSVDIYPGDDGTIYSGIYLGASNVGAARGAIEGVNILLQSDSNDPDKVNQMSVYVGAYPNWKVLKKVNDSIFNNGTREPVRLTVYITDQKLTIDVSLLSDPSQYMQFVYTYGENYDLTQGAVGIRGMNANNSFDNFTVVYQASDNDDSNTDVETDTDDKTDTDGNTDISVPIIKDTGDDGMMQLWMALMFLSLITMICAWNRRKKNS